MQTTFTVKYKHINSFFWKTIKNIVACEPFQNVQHFILVDKTVIEIPAKNFVFKYKQKQEHIKNKDKQIDYLLNLYGVKDIEEFLKNQKYFKDKLYKKVTKEDGERFIKQFNENRFEGISVKLVGSVLEKNKYVKDIDVVIYYDWNVLTKKDNEIPHHWEIMEKIGAIYLLDIFEIDKEEWLWDGFLIDTFIWD